MTVTIRLAPPLDSYRAPWSHASDEDRERLEFCACGLYVVQHRGESIPAVVRRHNDTPQHQAWRCEYASLLGPTVAPGAVDLSGSAAMRPAGERQA